jgi:hypothetical protein
MPPTHPILWSFAIAATLAKGKTEQGAPQALLNLLRVGRDKMGGGSGKLQQQGRISMKTVLKITAGLMASVFAVVGLAAVLAEPVEARKPCPKNWVMGPNGCQPGFITSKQKRDPKASKTLKSP